MLYLKIIDKSGYSFLAVKVAQNAFLDENALAIFMEI